MYKEGDYVYLKWCNSIGIFKRYEKNTWEPNRKYCLFYNIISGRDVRGWEDTNPPLELAHFLKLPKGDHPFALAINWDTIDKKAFKDALKYCIDKER